SSRRRHTRSKRDWSSDVCSSDLKLAPSAIPTKPAVAIQEVWVDSKFQCTASAAMMKEISPTSMASSAQPTPEPTNSFLCLEVTGSRSRRSFLLREEALV